MKIELDSDERLCLMSALDAAVILYKKTKQMDRAAEARHLRELLNINSKISMEVDFNGMTEFGRQHLFSTIQKREGRNKVIELFSDF